MFTHPFRKGEQAIVSPFFCEKQLPLNMLTEWGLFGLFVICFLASTLLPFPSEAAVIYFLSSGYPAHWVLIIASLGNALGGSTNYLLGYYGRKKLIKNKSYPKSERIVQRYGTWAALLAWAPFIGDPLMVLLGFYRTPMLTTMTLMSVGKIARYVILYLGFIAVI